MDTAMSRIVIMMEIEVSKYRTLSRYCLLQSLVAVNCLKTLTVKTMLMLNVTK